MLINKGLFGAESLNPSIPTRTTTDRRSAPETISVVTRTAVSLEYASIRHREHCPLGMYIMPSVENLLVWDAVFFVHQGYYADAILKFRISFPLTYPDKQPSVHFITDVFHPLIDNQTGTFNMAPRFRPWRPKEHHVFDILHYIKAAFKRKALDELQESDCLNKEAFRLSVTIIVHLSFTDAKGRYRDATSSFAALATQSSNLSQSPSALFISDHPSMIGKVSDGIKLKELTKKELQTGRAALGLSEWAEDS